MADLAGIRTLKQVVDGLLMKSGENKDNYFRFYQMAIDAYRELQLFHSRNMVWVKVTPDSLNRIAFPSDMLQFISLSVPVNGRLYTLTRDDMIVMTKSGTSPNFTLDSTDGEGVDVGTGYYVAYWSRGGVNQEGYFTIDYKGREIVISNMDKTEAVLCYVSNGVSSTSAYVNTTTIPAIESYILWKDKFYQRANPNETEYYKRQWEEEQMKLDVLDEPSLQELADAFFNTSTRTPKR